jgi:hypothetical protein
MKHHRARSDSDKNQNMFTLIVVVDYDNLLEFLEIEHLRKIDVKR